MAEATWKLKLEDDVSGAAETAAQALERLDREINADTKSLAAMQKALKNLQLATKPNMEQVDALKKRIETQRQTISKAQSSYVSLGGSFKASTGQGRGLEARLAALQKQAQQMPGPIGEMVQRLGSLRELLGGGAIAVGIVAISAAVVALTVATIAATRSLYKYGVAQADARRSELLRLEGLAKLRTLYSRIPGNAKEMQNAIDMVAAKTPLARAETAKYAEQLHLMGVRGPALAKALEGVAIKASVQGEAAASAFAGWAAGAALTGQSVDKLVDKVKSRLGGIAAKQMTSLTVQAEKQKEAFDSLFSGLEMDSYLSAWKGVNDLLTQATASGRALKTMTELLLQPLIDSSTKGAPLMKRFFQGMIIAALHLTIMLLTLRNWFKKTFGDSSLIKGIDGQRLAVMAGKTALGVMVVGLTLASIAVVGLSLKLTGWLIPALLRGTVAMFRFGIAGITGAVRGMAALAVSAWTAVPALWAALVPMLPFIAAAVGLSFAFRALYEHWDDLKLAFKQIDWLQAGSDIIDGIVSGLGIGPLIDKMKELGAGALKAFQEALGIASPSKEFMKLGLAIPQGVEAGVDKGAPGAQRAAADMVDVPRLGDARARGGALEDAGGAGAPGRSGGGTTFTFGDITIQATSDKPAQMAIDFRRELERVLEGLAAEIGAPVPGGAT